MERRRLLWYGISAFAVLIVAWLHIAVAMARSISPDDERMDLQGRVVDERGRPVKGARVDIWTAKPKSGYSLTCPYCYLDCSKEALTDGNGSFRIESLRADLVFKILVLAPGYVPRFFDGVEAREEVTFKLSSLNLKGIPQEKIIRIKVTDEEGRPLPGSYVEIIGERKGEPTGISDEKGIAILPGWDPSKRYEALITRPDFAPKYARDVKPGSELNEVILNRGVSVGGMVMCRITENSKRTLDVPLSGAVVVAAPKGDGGYLPTTYARTDENGCYLFTHLAADRPYDLFVMCNSTEAQRGYIAPPLRIDGLEKGEVREGINIILSKGRSISGRIVMPESQPVPEGSCAVATTPCGEVSAPIRKDGSFKLEGLPPLDADLIVEVPGFIPAEFLNSWGRVEPLKFDMRGDITGLVVHVKREGDVGKDDGITFEKLLEEIRKREGKMRSGEMFTDLWWITPREMVEEIEVEFRRDGMPVPSVKSSISLSRGYYAFKGVRYRFDAMFGEITPEEVNPEEPLPPIAQFLKTPILRITYDGERSYRFRLRRPLQLVISKGDIRLSSVKEMGPLYWLRFWGTASAGDLLERYLVKYPGVRMAPARGEVVNDDLCYRIPVDRWPISNFEGYVLVNARRGYLPQEIYARTTDGDWETYIRFTLEKSYGRDMWYPREVRSISYEFKGGKRRLHHIKIVRFYNLSINVDLPDEMFRISPPKGVSVYYE
ncbi:carboxypeptidase regulatory-like domain-containing protein [Candidatus Poribacteria bacterium]|nr:carboxypeptidase regulatory-like domain-containing protein [Candidatus Poribacteria bacterium]